MDKADLRREMRARRKALAAADGAAAARKVAAHARQLNLSDHQVVALYVAKGSELDARPLAEALDVGGLVLALPHAHRPDRPLEFRRWRPTDRLAPDEAGCLSPPHGDVTTPDVVIVPLLAYDGYGGRLGQGGGYYDRTLAALRRANPETRAIGIAFSAQAVERLELEPHDERLDGVLTEAGYTPAMKDPA